MTEPDFRELAVQVAGRMIERRDVKAIQRQNGAWNPVTDRETKAQIPFKLPDVMDHLRGTFTYGHYIVSAENACRMFAFDIDLDATGEFDSPEARTSYRNFLRETWAEPMTEAKKQLGLQMRLLAATLTFATHDTLSISPMVFYSGCKGMHVIVPLDPGTPAESARVLAQAVLDQVGDVALIKGKNFFAHPDYPNLSIELFPKQDEVREGDGLGNLMRLPLGIHRKSGKPGFCVAMMGDLTHGRMDDPMLALTQGSLR